MVSLLGCPDPRRRAYFRGMSDTASFDPGRRTASRILVAVGIVFGTLFAASIALWVHYGTAVFFEMISAGIAACF